MRYYIIAGEASGDLHGAWLMKQLRNQDSSCSIRFWGGDRMAKEGGEMVCHYRKNAVMGGTEVLSSIARILNNLSKCKKDIIKWKPDVVILIDYPGFNMRIASFAHKKGFKVWYFIPPKVWAHGESRVKALKRDVDRLLTIFPFETEYFKSHGIDAEYVGNPLCRIYSTQALESHPAREKVIAFFAGSRKAEIKTLLPRFMEVEKMIARDTRFNGYRLILAGAPAIDEAYYRKFMDKSSNIEIKFGCSEELLLRAEAAVVASGTANLEAALAMCPQLCCYVLSPVSYAIARAILKIDMISLPNIIMNRRIIKEMIQGQAAPKLLFEELESLIFDSDRREQMKRDYKELRKILSCS